MRGSQTVAAAVLVSPAAASCDDDGSLSINRNHAVEVLVDLDCPKP